MNIIVFVRPAGSQFSAMKNPFRKHHNFFYFVHFFELEDLFFIFYFFIVFNWFFFLLFWFCQNETRARVSIKRKNRKKRKIYKKNRKIDKEKQSIIIIMIKRFALRPPSNHEPFKKICFPTVIKETSSVTIIGRNFDQIASPIIFTL